MITIDGIPKKSGIAVAVAATVSTLNGINSVSPALLESGLQALRRGELPQDYPEAIIVCENLAVGAAIQIPGIKTIGIAAESTMDFPGFTVNVPCVTGIPGLMDSISPDDVIIVDGIRGVVHIDPDPTMLIHYQQVEQRRVTRGKVFISSEHIPAQTPSGETIYIHAHISDEYALAHAIDNGCDGLLVDLRHVDEETEGPCDLCAASLRDSAGKPVAFAVNFGCEPIIRSAVKWGVTGRVTLLSDSLAELAAEVDTAIELIEPEIRDEDLEMPEVTVGLITNGGTVDKYELAAAQTLMLDMRKALDSGKKILPKVKKLIGKRKPEDVIIAIDAHIDSIPSLIEAGARAIAVTPDRVRGAKYIVRSAGLEIEE